LKRDVVRLGAFANGIPVYEYRYLWDDADERQIGVIAQDVLPILPEAVHVHPITGFLMVDYDKVAAHG
jgi:hypothetical protein